MSTENLSATFFSAALTSLLLVLSLKYSGPGSSLHWLSLSGLLLLFWLSFSLARIDISRIHAPWGWLPAVMAGYLLWLLIAPFLSSYQYASSATAMGLAVLPLIFIGWLLLPEENKEQRWKLTWRLLVLGALTIGAWGAADFLIGHGRARAVFLDPNAYAAFLNMFLLPVACSYLDAPAFDRRLRSMRLLATTAALATAQFMSLSRGALLALLATLPLLLWSCRTSPFFRFRALVLLAVLAGAYGFVKVTPVDQNTGLDVLLSSPERYVEADPGIRERLLLWKSTLMMIRDANPIVGNGLGTFKIYYSAYRDARESSLGNFAHNDYLQSLHDGGIVQFSFFVLLTVVAPIALLVRRTKFRRKPDAAKQGDGTAAALMLAILCISIHAMVNFIHFVAPMIFLTGLYLARGWESVQIRGMFHLPDFLITRVKPRFLKAVAILLLAVPTSVLVLDGIIFKVFGTNDGIHKHFEPSTRFALINAALSLRPANPMPRILLIRALLDAADRSRRPQEREALLKQAEHETAALTARAPALAIGQYYFTGKIRALRGTPEDLKRARRDLERAVQLVPPATGMRLELVKVYRKLGLEKEAYETVLDAKKWLKLEVDLSSLAAFSREAEDVCRQYGDAEEAKFWAWIRGRLATIGDTG